MKLAAAVASLARVVAVIALRVVAVAALSLAPLVAFPLPVLATVITNPDSISINAVYAYHNLATVGDQLYLIDYNINYVSPPSTPANSNFLFRLNTAGGISLAVATPYPYYNNGYGRGVVAFYFSSGAPTWGDALTVQLSGNPLRTWTSGVPSVSSSISFWSISTTQAASQAELATRVLELALSIGTDWGGMLLASAAVIGTTLTTVGQTYFCAVIPNLQQMAPAAFSSYLTAPEAHKISYKDTYAANLAALLIGTPLDFTKLASKLGWTIGWTNSLVVFVGIFVLDALLVWKVFRSTKGILLLDDFIFTGASVLGMLPIIVVIGIGIAAAFMTLYVVFYQKSGA